MVAPLVNLQVGAAGERDLHLDQDFAFPHPGNGYLFNLDVFFAVQDGSGHFSVHCESPSHVLPG